MVMESFDLTEPAQNFQKRDTRKLLIAGLTCIFLAVVSIAIVIAVILRQNEEERIPHSYFNNQYHTSSDSIVIGSVQNTILSSVELSSSLSDHEVYGTSNVIVSSTANTKVHESSLLTNEKLFSSSMSMIYSHGTESDVYLSTLHPEILSTYSSLYNVPYFSTSSLSLLPYYESESIESGSESISTDTKLQQSESTLVISITDNFSLPFSTLHIEELQSNSNDHDIETSVISSMLDLPEFSVPTNSQDLQTENSILTMLSMTSDFDFTIQTSRLFSLSTVDEIATTVSSVLDYSEDIISTHVDLPITENLNTSQYRAIDDLLSDISLTEQSTNIEPTGKIITTTSETTVESPLMLLTTVLTNDRQFTMDIDSWMPSVTTSDVYYGTSVFFSNSKFVSGSLDPHQTSYQMVDFSDSTTLNNIYSTQWSQSSQHSTVLSTLYPACSTTEFRCNSGQCVPKDKRCDRFINCEDMTDEFNCTNCLGDQCDNGLCLWSWKAHCNKRVDCIDLSDEINCDFGTSYNRCDNGISVPTYKWCDNVDDCFDNSDEVNCTCSFMEKSCTDGHCIREEWICDGHVDCIHATDEANCSNCTPEQYTCSDYSCINSSQICDGISHCLGAEDETMCYYLNQDEALRIQLRGENYTVCGSHWNSGISDYICQTLGYKISTETRYFNMTNNNITDFIELDKPLQDYKYLLQHMEVKSSCTTHMTVSITCMQRECGETSPDIMKAYVAGGDISTVGQWPWVVSLSYLGRPFCSGTLISNEWVVTAGHCVAIPGSHNYTENPHYTEVLLGSVKRLRDHGTSRRADKIIRHPRLQWTGIGPIYYDVALVHLEKPVNFDNYILPICLPKPDFSSLTNCYIVGWGYIGHNQDVTVQDLREAKLHVFTDLDCQLNTVPLEQVVDTNITYCAGYKFGVISGCQGDSGSPMMCQDTTNKWTLTGVMSSGASSCGVWSTIANRFTKIPAMLKWMEDIIGN